MDAKKILVALVLIAIVAAIPSFATFEKDVITPEAIQAVLKKTNYPNSNVKLSEDAINALSSKTVISNKVLEEALFKINTINNGISDVVNGFPCGESCVYIPCLTAAIGCSCKNKVCYKNSLSN